MDPLSITASSIAVLSALTASGKGVKKLLSLRHAPELLQDLSNEVESLRLLVTQVQQAFLSIHGSQLYHDHEEAVKSILERMRRPVNDLQALVEFQLTRPVSNGASSRLSKSEWLKAGSEIEKHRRRICEAANHLTLAMTAMNVQQQALQIQSITLVSQRFQDLQDTVSGSRFTAVGGSQPGLVAQADRVSSQLDEQPPAAAESSESIGTTAFQTAVTTTRRPARSLNHNSETSFVRVTATLNVRKCANFCPCQCHVTTHIQTPRMLRDVLGQLFFTYTSLLRVTPCNFPRCQKSVDKSRFLYYFPTWLAARALTVSGYARDIAGPEASWAVKIPAVLDSGSAVWFAIHTGNIAFLQKAFSAGFKPWTINEFGDTALRVASDHHQLEMVRFLLAHNADPNSEDANGRTPFTVALELGRTHGTELLHTLNGVLEDVVETLSFTSLHAAAALLPGYGHLTPELLGVEFRDVNSRDRSGMTPLHWACHRGDAPAVELLLRWDADAHAYSRKGTTCLHHAASSGDIDSVRLLLDAGCVVDVPNKQGKTAIFYAADPPVLELLAHCGGNVSHGSIDGNTPLHRAVAQSRSLDTVQKLVDHGADIHAENNVGHDAISLAVLYDRPRALRLLLSASHTTRVRKERWKSIADVDGDCSNDLHLAALFTSVEVMQVLAHADLEGWTPTLQDEDGDTPTDCFYRFRDQNCVIIRPPFEEEEQAWWDLMRSACRQNGIDFNTFEPEWRKEYMRNAETDVETLGSEEEDDQEDDEGIDEEDDEEGEGNNATSSEDDANAEDEAFTDAVQTQSDQPCA